MKVLSKLKKLVKVADFFYSTQLLRYDDDLQYKTLTGGIVSLGIIATIIVGFANLILDTLTLNSFTISTQTVKNIDPTPSAIEISDQSPFRFAVDIWYKNITEGKRYFDITFSSIQSNNRYIKSMTHYPLKPCTKEFFKGYPQITNNFESLNARHWLCLPLNMTLNLQGKYSSANYSQYIIQVSACHNQTDPSRPCASPQEIQKYFKQNQNQFIFDIYYTNIQINPDKKDYKQYYIEEQTYALFGSNIGTQSFLYFTDYTVSTDISIWPFSKVVTDSGCYSEDKVTYRSFETNINSTYIRWYIVKSTNSIIYTRSVQKLSIVFSFMGGMIGAVSAVLFIIKTYTNVAFEFSIAFQIFKPQSSNNQLECKKENSPNQGQTINIQHSNNETTKKSKMLEISMNFFTFIRYHIYTLFNFIGINYNSPEMKYAQECKEQISNQLDIKKLLKRIIFIEHCLTKILDDYHLDVLQLKKPQTPQEIRQIRLKCESIVDQQMQKELNRISDKSLAQIKQEADIQALQAQTPNDMKRDQGKDRRTSKSQSGNTVQVCQFQKEKPTLDIENGLSNQTIKKSTLDIKNELMVFNLQEDKVEHLESTMNNLNTMQTNKIVDIYKRERKRESNLAQLVSTVSEGNAISNNIWKRLDPQTKKMAARCSKIQINHLLSFKSKDNDI